MNINTKRMDHEFDTVYQPLVSWLVERFDKQKGPLVVGISGAQGSGKSTCAQYLESTIGNGFDLNVVTFSIDDIYLTRSERMKLAEDVHPLLKTRGVPGTHDLNLGSKLIHQLRGRGGVGVTALPTFNKAIDDRNPECQWRTCRCPVDIIIFEGWCVGARPQDETELHEPVNALERECDPDGIWRQYVNQRLQSDYRKFWEELDVLIMLKIPDFDYVFKWRRLQERKLIETMKSSEFEKKGRGMSDEELKKFIMHYERLTRVMLAEMPARADALLTLNENHNICKMTLN